MPLVVDDTEALLDHALQIDPAPAQHTVTLPIRPRFGQGLSFGLLCFAQAAVRPCVQMIAQAIQPFSIEAVSPVPQRLAVYTAYMSHIGAAGPVTDRRQGQKPARSVGMLAARRKSP